ncbi:hypothetical protein [Treponema sp.]|uniref:hypothetical protein n=1 Tax=Treponema sp. TaxID=166 RepID=UPI0025D3C8DA|nr:hypothetical protein [Treponema sp.]MCR5218927.1 hypothetical protein [Treponema sp.]
MIRKIMAAALTFAAMLSVSCVAVKVDKEDLKDYREPAGTPENSVVFIVATDVAQKISFSQMDPDYPADMEKVNGNVFVSKPVAPGSTYFLKDLVFQRSYYVGNTVVVYNYDLTYPMQPATVPLVVNVPKKPGIYFLGYATTGELFENDGYELKKDAKGEAAYLKGALKLYKGTVWEDAINKRIEELGAE